MTTSLCGTVIAEEAVLDGLLGAELHGLRGFIPNVVFFGRAGEDCGEDGIGDLGLGRALARMILAAGFRDFFRIGLGGVSWTWMSAACPNILDQSSSPLRLVFCDVPVECSAVAVILRVTRRVGEWKVVLPPSVIRVTTAILGYRQDVRVIAIVCR